jgi:hypothetical protein
MRRTSKRLMFP